MNQANQLQGESKHCKLLFEAKNNVKIRNSLIGGIFHTDSWVM